MQIFAWSRRSVLFAVMVLACGSCTREADKYRADLEMMCNAMRLSKADEAPIAARSTIAGRYVNDHLKSAGARELIKVMSRLEPEQKGRRLKEEAQKAGLSSCPMAETWEAAATPPGL